MDNKEKNFVSAVIYVHNAEDQIKNFLLTIITVLKENFECSEIICVNDSSEDNSLMMIKNMSVNAVASSISVINMSHFHGLELSMNAGINLSIGDFVFEFDSMVLDYDPHEIMAVYKRALQGYDIVCAVPDKTEKMTSKIFYKVFECFTNQSYQMHTESFRVLSRRVINRISSMNKTIPYRKAIYAAAGLKTDRIIYKSLPFLVKKPDKKEKKYRFELAVDALILFTKMGYQFSITMTLLMMLISIAVTIYSVIIYMSSSPVAGWTTTIVFLSFAFFGLFGILTIIIKYLQLIVNLLFRKKQFSYESIEKLTK